MLRTLSIIGRYLLPESDPTWCWRRRMAFFGCSVFLGGIAHSVWFDGDFTHSSMVMTFCTAGFQATLATYVGLAVTDDHLRRKSEDKSGTQ
jgi:hypothetical protein